MYNKAIDQFISYCLEPHEVRTSEKYPDSIFWVKDGKIIVDIEESKDFWLRNDIWEDISRMFNFNYDETQSTINIWLEQHHNLEGVTPKRSFILGLFELEQHHNLG